MKMNSLSMDSLESVGTDCRAVRWRETHGLPTVSAHCEVSRGGLKEQRFGFGGSRSLSEEVSF